MSFALRAFKALSDETRLRLLAVLSRYELSVNELVMLMGMGQSRVSRHLKILAEAGLLESRRDGLWVFYSTVESGQGHDFLAAMEPFMAEAESPDDIQMARYIIDERTRKTRQFFNAIAEDWDALSRDVLGSFDLPVAVAELMPDSCEVAVDLGCGTGAVLERMRAKAKQLVGVDGSARMLELSRRRFADDSGAISLRIGELDHLPLRDDEADFACINMVLHHLSDPLPALGEIRRVVRPGGVLLVSDFDRHDHEQMRTEYGDHWLGFDRDTLRDLLAKAGFSLERTECRPVEQGLAVNMMLARRIA